MDDVSQLKLAAAKGKEIETLTPEAKAILDDIRKREAWQQDLKPWGIALTKHYVAWLAGLIVSCGGFFGVQPGQWLWWFALAAGVLISSFQTWHDQENIIRKLANRAAATEAEIGALTRAKNQKEFTAYVGMAVGVSFCYFEGEFSG